jgi:hypothetical protein
MPRDRVLAGGFRFVFFVFFVFFIQLCPVTKPPWKREDRVMRRASARTLLG